jgi:ABC-type uncharacterized transport system permease subunit
MEGLQPIVVLLPVTYLLAAILYAMEFGGPRAPRVVALRRVALGAAMGLHTVFLVALWAGAGSFPHLDLLTAFSFVALFTALLFTAVSWNVEKKSIGGVVLSIVFLLQLVASCFADLRGEARPAGVAHVLHVATSILACSSVVLSGVLGGLYLLMYRQMRRRTFGVLFNQLPDLRTLARLTRRSALAGFLLLGLGLNVGIGWAHSMDLGTFRYTDPFVLVILGLWVHFGVVAFSRRIPGVTAWRASFAAAAGFLVLVAALLLTLTTATFHLQR